METVAEIVVAMTGLYFIVLAAAALLRPARATAFLLGFAGSARAHYAEMIVRLLVGSALVVRASHMAFGYAFLAFGWVIVVTTVGLLFVPWALHHRFAQKVVPPAMRYIPWIGALSLVIGGAILWSLAAGPDG